MLWRTHFDKDKNGLEPPKVLFEQLDGEDIVSIGSGNRFFVMLTSGFSFDFWPIS